MTDEVHRWLPAGAVANQALRAASTTLVDGWSKHWFAGTSLRLSGVKAVDPALRRPVPGGWRIYRQDVGVSLSERGQGQFVLSLLDMKSAPLAVTRTDQAVLDALEHTVLEDLAARFEEALGGAGPVRGAPESVDHPFGPLGGAEISIMDDLGDHLVSVSLPLARASRLAPSVRIPANARALTPLKEALAPTEIHLEAILGRSTVTLSELRALAPGDVLVLDRRLDEAVEVCAAGDGRHFARAKFEEAEGGAILEFQL